MLQPYVLPISYAFMTFPLAALLFTLPFMVVQYRRHGYIHKFRAFMLYLLLLYLMNAVYLVLLPFPASRDNLPMSGSPVQLVPFRFVTDIARETAVIPGEWTSYLLLFGERAFLQVIFNIALLMPLGMALRYYFRARWKWVLALSFGFSLFIEITQLTGIYGFYAHPYRLFDVDDLMTNTLGGMLGYLLAEWLSGLLPKVEKLDQDLDRSAKRVTYTRRSLALLFDALACGFLWLALHRFGVPASYWAATGLYFILLPRICKGQTPGKWIVRIRVADENGNPPSLLRLGYRYGLLYWALAGLIPALAGPLLRHISSPQATLVLRVAILAVYVRFSFHLIRALLGRKPLFYEKLSRTLHIISWPQDKLADRPDPAENEQEQDKPAEPAEAEDTVAVAEPEQKQ